MQESVFKKHYVDYYFINDQDIFLKICSLPIQLTRHAEFVKKLLKVLEVKKPHVFFHYEKHQQKSGNRGARTSALAIIVLKRGPIIYYSINFNLYKKLYDFFRSGIVDAFLECVYEIYLPTKENKFQGYAEIVSQ